jgi:hypothetical protein
MYDMQNAHLTSAKKKKRKENTKTVPGQMTKIKGRVAAPVMSKQDLLALLWLNI